MKILIAGAGKVGATMVRQLSDSDLEIVLIDNDKEALEANCERYDVMGLLGNCASVPVLEEAGVAQADLLIAATSLDEVNLLCCATAHHLNPRLHTIARVRDPEYSDEIFTLKEFFGLSMTINPEQTAAEEIASLIRYPAFLQRDRFAKGKVEIVELQVEENSPMCHVALKDLSRVAGCRVLVCAVIRDGKSVSPGGSFVLEAGDRIEVTAPASNLNKMLRHLGFITVKPRRVILCGGGKVSYYLSRRLITNGIEVQIIDSDPERCRTLAESLPEVSVICGDATDKELLEKEGLSSCDALVTLTGRDEINVLISLYARSRGVPQVITKQSDTGRFAILGELPLGAVISPKELCSNAIVQYVRTFRDQSGDTPVSVQPIADGAAQACEFLIRDDEPHQNIPLKDLKLKPGILIAAVTRGRSTMIADGASSFKGGDSVIVVAGSELLHFRDIFA
ncbi:MAG: Trk system potassium transporter TrkA [Lachnospiraceae bacterium]|nr:Trk system potassium transporter TrkA [Lachnospiraceae bacterium]